jgi:ribosomal-protein-alanine N-acetyltransferase
MAALHAHGFPDRPWSAEEIEDLLRADTVQSFESPCERGWLLTRVLPPEAEILTLAVDPQARRQGVAADLLARWIATMAQQNVTDLHLEVAADNVAALALYERCRFVPSGRRPRYYTRPDGAPVDAMLMHRALPLTTGR